MKYRLYLLTALVILLVFGGQWFGPSDLYDNDQPKTVAYTVDMVEHGRWLLPVDMLGRPATKPPMYNWIGAPVVAAGWHSEFALKMPSTLAALVLVILTWWVAHRAAERIIGKGVLIGWDKSRGPAVLPGDVAAIACICLVACQMFLKLSYTARPDMVLTAFLAGGWVAASRLFEDQPDDHRPSCGSAGRSCSGVFGLQLALWLCVAGAALTKGLPALLLIAYILLGARLIGGRWSALWRTGVLWGLPLALALFGAWAYGAYQRDPEHFNNVFMGAETLDRISRGGPIGIIEDLWRMPAWFIARFLPWSLFAVMWIVHVWVKRSRGAWLSDPDGPSILWLILVVVFFDFSGGKRADYLAPVLPAVAVLASFWLAFEGRRLWGMRAWQAATIGLFVALLMLGYELTGAAAAREGYGQRVRHFAQEVTRVTGNQPIRFRRTAYTPLQSLLGYNQPARNAARVAGARWLIKPADGPGAVVVSEPIWVGGKRVEVRMGLYPLRPGNRRLDAPTP